MKLSINRNSLIFRLATVYGSVDAYEKSSDLCTYFWGIVIGFAMACGLVVIGSVCIGALVLLPSIAVIEYFSSGYFSYQEPHIILLFIDAVLVSTGLVVFSFEGHGEVVSNTSVAKLAKAGYRGWKEKTCVLVEVQQ